MYLNAVCLPAAAVAAVKFGDRYFHDSVFGTVYVVEHELAVFVIPHGVDTKWYAAASVKIEIARQFELYVGAACPEHFYAAKIVAAVEGTVHGGSGGYFERIERCAAFECVFAECFKAGGQFGVSHGVAATEGVCLYCGHAVGYRYSLEISRVGEGCISYLHKGSGKLYGADVRAVEVVEGVIVDNRHIVAVISVFYRLCHAYSAGVGGLLVHDHGGSALGYHIVDAVGSCRHAAVVGRRLCAYVYALAIDFAVKVYNIGISLLHTAVRLGVGAVEGDVSFAVEFYFRGVRPCRQKGFESLSVASEDAEFVEYECYFSFVGADIHVHEPVASEAARYLGIFSRGGRQCDTAQFRRVLHRQVYVGKAFGECERAYVGSCQNIEEAVDIILLSFVTDCRRYC